MGGCGSKPEETVVEVQNKAPASGNGTKAPTKSALKKKESKKEDKKQPEMIAKSATGNKTDEASNRILGREQQIKLHTKNRKAVQGRILDLEGDFKAPNYPKTKGDVKFLDVALKENFIFGDLTTKERKLLINAMQKQEAKKGEVIITQGDVGDFFYVLEEGTINFVANGKDVGSCGKGASFGELALLYDSPRAATCIAGEASKLWKVDQLTFRHLLARTTKEQEGGIVDILAKIPLFKDMDRGVISKFAKVLTNVTFSEGEVVVKKGDVGEVFYIIGDGQVRVHDIGLGDASYADQILKSGDWFGERALMTGEPRAANVTAMIDTHAYAVDRETFETTIGPLDSILGQESRKRFIKSVPIFAKSELLSVEYELLVALVTEKTFPKGSKLMEAGKVCDKDLYIVKDGKLMISSAVGSIFFLGSGDYYGDKAVKTSEDFISDETCICEEKTTCWVLKQSDIESVIGDLNRLGKPLPFVSSSLNTQIQLKDVRKHRILGMGAFGKVWLASTNESSTPYALKTIDKAQLLQANQVKGVIREKQIMASIEHPFILPLIGSFQDEYNLYLLLPLIQGGELFNVIHTQTRDGISNEACLFYAGCVLEALGHLHARNIVYRDMKPENALIDNNGYCILIDLGFAKIVVDKTFTLCGTPEYLAPEIIMSKGHDKAVDYWSFGVLVYEMLVGRSPFYFYGTDQVSLFKRIVMVKYSCPASVNEEAKDMIKKLLTRRQASRLGNLSRGYADVKEHPYFDSLDFVKLNNREIKAPWIPNIKNPLDASHFEDFSKEERETDRPFPLGAKEQEVFKDF
eukprot:Nitzschia sp. Nitz4//scaffold330_size19141//14677//17509//NITZ4_008748-RA/size19141-snap-gene-0.28-mRNA-1//-1//CDS//3329548166//4089//frame0